MAMTTQRINIDINTTPVEPIVMRVGESYNRVFEFVLGRYDDDVFVPLSYTWESELEPVRAKFRLLKPDKTFVIADMIVTQETDGKKVFSILQTPEMSQVGGVGYYDIRVCNTSDDAEFAYSVQGKCIIDDDMITDEMIESVASANGYTFPDDFLTSADLSMFATKQYVDDAIAEIPDPTTNYSTTEHIIGKWIDGTTPVYEKTFYIPNPAYNVASGTRVSDSEFENINQVISIEGTFKRLSNANVMAYKFDGGETASLSGDAYGWTRVDISDGGNHGILYFIRVRNESAKDAIITVRYTKNS